MAMTENVFHAKTQKGFLSLIQQELHKNFEYCLKNIAEVTVRGLGSKTLDKKPVLIQVLISLYIEVFPEF